jgi:hypothetical protein
MPEDIEDESVVVEVETTGEEEQDTRAQVSSNDDGDELDSYSKNVQTRIKKLTEKYRNEERVRTEAERLYQQVLAENQQLKGRVQNLDKGYLNEFGVGWKDRLNLQNVCIVKPTIQVMWMQCWLLKISLTAWVLSKSAFALQSSVRKSNNQSVNNM